MLQDSFRLVSESPYTTLLSFTLLFLLQL